MLKFWKSRRFGASASLARAVRHTIEQLESRVLFSTYYFSPSGNDNANGLTPATAWKSVDKANALDLNAGDKVLFEGGQTFANNPVPTPLINGGFESGNLNGWNGPLSGATVSSNDAHSGTYGLRTATNGANSGGENQFITSGVERNAGYVFRAWGKISNTDGSGWVGIHFIKNGVSVMSIDYQVVTAFYSEYYRAFVTPADFDSVEIYSYKNAGSSVLSTDDFSLTETPNTIALGAEDTGTAANPIVIGSYGTGRATLQAGDGMALFAVNASGIEVNDLRFTGSYNALGQSGANISSGVEFQNTLANNTKLNYLRVNNVETSGFKLDGIRIAGYNVKSGFNDVRITNSSSHDNGDAGIVVVGTFLSNATTWSHTNLYIADSQAYNNAGIANANIHTGDGIRISDVNGATLERNVAYNNGQWNNFTGGGPFGIWAFDSNAVVIQYNESYNNKSSNQFDGGGFDLDGGTSNSIIQYNYSHGNRGAGLLAYQYGGARAWKNNIFRYNISENDCRGGGYGGIYLGGSITQLQVYNNTVYLTPFTGVTPAGIRIRTVGTAINLRNNIVVTTGGVRLMDSGTTNGNVTFQGNDFWSTSPTFQMWWGSTNYSSLAAFRTGTGQEKLNGNNTGFQLDPQLKTPGGGGTIGFGGNLTSLLAYTLKDTSPMINAGLNLTTLFGLSVGTRDFYGNTIPVNGAFDIGAHEYNAAPSGPPVANAGGPYVITEGQAVLLSAAASTGVISTYEWDFNYNGVNFDVDATGSAPSIAAGVLDGPLTRTIALRVSGPNGTNTATSSITVNSAAPIVSAGADANILPGATFNGGGSFTDPGPDTWTATVDYGDGNGPIALALNGKSFTLSKTYAQEGTYNVTVKISDDDGEIGTDTLVVNVTQAPPAPTYTSANIGTVNPSSGTNIVTDGKDYDVTAGGAGVWTKNDNFRFVYAQRTGDFDIKVRVASISGGDPTLAQAGLMIRETLAANSRNAMLYARPDAKDTLQARKIAGDVSDNVASGAGTAFPNNWLRLQRVGDIITAYRSGDGVVWTKTGSVTLTALTPTVYVGLAVSSRLTSSATTVQFRDLGDVV